MPRNRNTLVNRASKQDPFGSLVAGGAGVPAPSPGTTVDLYAGLANLYQQYQAQLAQLRLQRTGLRGTARVQRADVRAQGIAGMAGAVNEALAAGTVGSSYDLEQRIAVRAEQARGLETVRQDLLQGLAGTRIAQIQAGLGFQQGVFGLEAQVAAQQAEQATQALLQNAIISGGESTADQLKSFYQNLLGMVAAPSASTVGAAPPSPEQARRLARRLMAVRK